MRCRFCFLLSLTLTALACGGEGRTKPKPPTTSALVEESEELEARSSTDDAPDDVRRQAVTSEAALDPNAALLEASYDVQVDAVGFDVCTGSADLKLNTSAGKGPNAGQVLEIPAGVIDCAGYKIDLRELLGSLTQGAGASNEPPIVVEGGVIALPVMGTGQYTPARPIFPSFLAEDRDTPIGRGNKRH
jgi:hypothetical protein